MKISGRNQLPATVKKIQVNGPVAEVIMDCAGNQLTALITAGSINDLAIAEGDRVTALVKSTSVMVMK